MQILSAASVKRLGCEREKKDASSNNAKNLNTMREKLKAELLNCRSRILVLVAEMIAINVADTVVGLSVA